MELNRQFLEGYIQLFSKMVTGATENLLRVRIILQLEQEKIELQKEINKLLEVYAVTEKGVVKTGKNGEVMFKGEKEMRLFQEGQIEVLRKMVDIPLQNEEKELLLKLILSKEVEISGEEALPHYILVQSLLKEEKHEVPTEQEDKKH